MSDDARIDDDGPNDPPDHLDLELEVPEADALDQRRNAPLPDDDPHTA